MKRINLFILFFFLLFLCVRVNATGKYVGNCYCHDGIANKYVSLSCEEKIHMVEKDETNFLEWHGVCGFVCMTNGSMYWVGSPDYYGSETPTPDQLKECVFVEDTKVEEQKQKNCKWNYTEDACKALRNGKWNTDTGCCELTKLCYLHLETGMNMDGGTLYYQEESPCSIQENIDKYPSQKCEVRDLPEDKCKTEEGQKSFSSDLIETEKSQREMQRAKGDIAQMPDSNLDPSYMTCKQILGDTLSQVVKGGITVIQIAAAIIAIIKGMTLLIPPIVNKDADKLKEATGKLVVLGILLIVVIIFRPIVRLIGTIFGFDTTCIL